jgi:hypothetical protein
MFHVEHEVLPWANGFTLEDGATGVRLSDRHADRQGTARRHQTAQVGVGVARAVDGPSPASSGRGATHTNARTPMIGQSHIDTGVPPARLPLIQDRKRHVSKPSRRIDDGNDTPPRPVACCAPTSAPTSAGAPCLDLGPRIDNQNVKKDECRHGPSGLTRTRPRGRRHASPIRATIIDNRRGKKYRNSFNDKRL